MDRKASELGALCDVVNALAFAPGFEAGDLQRILTERGITLYGRPFDRERCRLALLRARASQAGGLAVVKVTVKLR